MKLSKLGRRLDRFDSAVLTWIDEGGFPFSIRCRPIAGIARLKIGPLGSLPVQAGAAGLLYHSHNDRLWKLRMLLVVGLLEQEGEGWFFRPQRIVTGVAGVNKLHMLKSFLNARRTTRRYLRARGMPRPAIPWRRIKALQKESND